MSFNRISLRIAAWYSAAFFVCALLLFVLVGFFLASSLHTKDKELLEAKYIDYSAIFEKEGVSGLRTRASSIEIPDAARYLVRVTDPSGKTLFIHPPAVPATELNPPTIDDIEAVLSKHQGDSAWLTVPGKDFGDDIEVLSRKLPSGHLLQVGKDIEDREDFMKGYARAFFSGLIPIFLLAILAGLLLSNRILAPIRWLTATITQIREGKESARVPRRNNGDDFDRLGTIFNQMLDQNDLLVRGMKETLDHVAHDLRTPVMRLQSSAQQALQTATSVEACKDALADCQENSEIISKMLNTIMDISEAEAGTLHLTMERVKAETLIEQVVSLYGFVAEAKEISLVTGQVDNLEIEGDRTRLLQALANLVDNAVKYSPSGSSITLSAKQEGEMAVISVQDHGPGIPESEHSKIWTRLYRGEHSRSTRGMGLGLSVVRAIAIAHRGNAEIRPNSGPGSTFQLLIPAGKPAITKM